MSDVAVTESGTCLQKILDRTGLRGFPWKTAICLYTISWGWLFIIRNSIWSDDWDLFRFRKNTNYKWKNFGFPPWKDLDIFFYELFGAQFFRVLTFLSFLLSSIFAYGISLKILNLSSSQRRAIALLFLVLPFNSARISMMVSHYTLAYFYFFLAWYLIVVFRGPRIKILCLFLFFLSFQMHSMLFFYFFPVAHYLILSELKNWNGFFLWLRHNIFLVSLPAIYWTCKVIFWPTTHKLPNSRAYQSVSRADFLFSLIFAGSAFAVLFFLYYLCRKFDARIRANMYLIILGLALMAVTSLPYILYGAYRCCQIGFIEDYLATLFGRRGWASRHQMLQPLGAAFLTVGLVSLVPKILQKLKRLFIIFILLVSILFNLSFGFEAFTEFSKHSAVIAKIVAKGDFERVQRYVIEDETSELNFLNNRYSAKQWAGLIATATDASVYEWFDIIPSVGTSKKLVISCQSLRDSTLIKYRGPSRIILIHGPPSRWQALNNLLSFGKIGYDVQVIDSPYTCDF